MAATGSPRAQAAAAEAAGQGKCGRSRHETSCRADVGSLYPAGIVEGEGREERKRAADDDVAAHAACM